MSVASRSVRDIGREIVREAPLPLLPLLVDARCWRSKPLWPCAVASTDGLMTAVFTVFVIVVVAKVTVEVGSECERASLERKTSANPGAGTLMAQVVNRACSH